MPDPTPCTAFLRPRSRTASEKPRRRPVRRSVLQDDVRAPVETDRVWLKPLFFRTLLVLLCHKNWLMPTPGARQQFGNKSSCVAHPHSGD